MCRGMWLVSLWLTDKVGWPPCPLRPLGPRADGYAGRSVAAAQGYQEALLLCCSGKMRWASLGSRRKLA
jgi:hypothetical protein